jgi:carboxymethylenebutenolidase
MPTINRRAALAGFALLTVCHRARAGMPDRLSVEADEGSVAERVSALAVLYGGMPDAMVPEVKRLPPLIELHGEADRNVPFAKGAELVQLAKAIGADAELIAYPGKPHGFHFSDTDPMTADAVSRVVKFFESRLKS